ncbi:hypothetical protein [Terrimonas alba]|uniref:hypothetical protein n=1 Tax=Terrimonas alba TaxID=3349636 RepID=UPI0035F41174
MEDTFFSYLHRLELIAFFSGYPLIYAIVFFIAGSRPSKNKLKGKIFFLLPFAYALVGTLYLGLQLKTLYLDHSVENIKQSFHQPFLIGWGLLAMLFWIPAIAKKPVLSLLHSFVFFFFLIKDMFFQLPAFAVDKNIVRNDMKLYTDSLLLNIGALITITLIYFFLFRLKDRKESSGV